jgi:hypothetical protein
MVIGEPKPLPADRGRKNAAFCFDLKRDASDI